jgi:3-dehydroquinate synthase
VANGGALTAATLRQRRRRISRKDGVHSRATVLSHGFSKEQDQCRRDNHALRRVAPIFCKDSLMPDIPNTPARDATVVPIDLGPRAYEIVIRPGSLGKVASVLAAWRNDAAPGTALLVTDSHLESSHARTVGEALRSAGWNVGLHVMPPGESSKSIAAVTAMYDTLVELRADRRSLVIAVGGGVVGDAAGFAAATYNRGMPFVQIPTSLLAMVDSSVGGKVGINHPRGKNLIGAFHQPLGVLIDPAVLATLPEREYRSGLAEVVKYGVILDAEFFAFLEENSDAIGRQDEAALSQVIARSCRLKADVVERDEYETTGLRMILNYGHTFGHAFEALAGYGTLTHGEAVAIGMIYASRLAERRGLIPPEVTQRQMTLLQAFGLPTRLPQGQAFSAEDVIARMRLDKKNTSGRLRFILPVRLGEVRAFDDVPEDDVAAVLRGDVPGGNE